MASNAVRIARRIFAAASFAAAMHAEFESPPVLTAERISREDATISPFPRASNARAMPSAVPPCAPKPGTRRSACG